MFKNLIARIKSALVQDFPYEPEANLSPLDIRDYRKQHSND